MAAICNVCGLPDELCICQEIAKEQLQGDHKKKAAEVLKNNGFNVEVR